MSESIDNKQIIETLISEKNWDEIKKTFAPLHASEAAELLAEIDQEYQVTIYRLLPKKFAVKIFSYLEPDDQEFLTANLKPREVAFLLAEIEPDDRTALFEEVSDETASSLLKLLSPDNFEEVNRLLSYPDESVGRVMTTDFISVYPDWTAQEATDYIRKKGAETENIDAIYYTDNEGKIAGEIHLSALVLAHPNEFVKNLQTKPIITLSVYDDQEKAVNVIKKYNRTVLPVVDSDNMLVGIVTIDDLMDVEEEEITEDFHKISGVIAGKGEKAFTGNLLDTSVKFLYRNRIFWLMLLIFVNIFSGAAIARFEDVISRSVKLVFFLPLLIDSGGNAGAQSATLMVRALGTGDAKIKDWFELLRKEFLISALLGITMALGTGLLGIMRGGYEIAIIVTISMILIVIAGSVVGMSLPFLFTKLNRDPASACGPLVTSIADICGVLIYFSIANKVLFWNS